MNTPTATQPETTGETVLVHFYTGDQGYLEVIRDDAIRSYRKEFQSSVLHEGVLKVSQKLPIKNWERILDFPSSTCHEIHNELTRYIPTYVYQLLLF